MKKVYLLKGLSCPNCSAKIENDVKKLNGITFCSVNLMQQTLTVCTDGEFHKDFTDTICRTVHQYEPEIEVSLLNESTNKKTTNRADSRRIIRLIIGAIVFISFFILTSIYTTNNTLNLCLFLIPYLILGFDVVTKAVKNIFRGRIFDENFLMTISTVGAFCIGSYSEAVAVMLFYQLGEFFQELAVNRSRKSISALMDIRPDSATVCRNDNLYIVSPESVSIGETIIIKPGEKIPLDGIITEGESMIDTRALTGESMPRLCKCGDRILSGCINTNGVLTVKVTKSFSESTASKVLDLVENASARKASAEKFITVFSRYYTPAVVIAAAALAIIPPIILNGGWLEWIERCFVFLVISCPCALVISIPLSFFGGIGAASKQGILIKGSNYLDALTNLDTVIFDKTGTLTHGVFEITKLHPANGFLPEQVLEYAAFAESFSNHPIAFSILSAYGKDIDKNEVCNYKELSGYGISASVRGCNLLVGNDKLMNMSNVEFISPDDAGTIIHIAVDNCYAGYIVIADKIKEDSKKTVLNLKKLGIRKTVMLTGDSKKTGMYVAEKLGIDEYHSELLPQQKIAVLESLLKNKNVNGKIAFVGDGINDAPALARTDVGIAMGGLGSDAAIEAADIVLMTDEPSKLITAITIAKKTKRIVTQNIVFSIGAKVIFLILGGLGMAEMWTAVFGDVGVMLIAVLNSMRILNSLNNNHISD